MSDIALYMFDSGTLKTQMQNIKMNQGLGEEFEVPVPWYLITHPRGHILIDGGNAAAVAEDAGRHWGAVSEVYQPIMTPEQAVIPRLQAAGIELADVRWIVQSHLHLDHSGAVSVAEEFRNAQVLCHRDEYIYAHSPDWFAAGGYISADFAREGIPWVFLDAVDDGYDLYGDGVFRCWYSPGHSVGHMSFEVNLPTTGSVLLTADAAYTTDHWDEKALPGFLASTVDTVRSVRKLKRIAARSNSMIVTGHDPDTWAGFTKASEGSYS